MRIYSASECPGPGDARVAATVALGAVPLISFKTWNPASRATFTALLRTLDRATVTFHHEPEDNPLGTADIAACYTDLRADHRRRREDRPHPALAPPDGLDR